MSQHASYKAAGVDIDLLDATKKMMSTSIDTADGRVLNKMGAFASLLEGKFPHLQHPVLVYKTEEPGSKQILAYRHGRLPAIAADLVNHLINDVVVMGAEPLYMQDCIVCSNPDRDLIATLVANMAAACRQQGCALVGGETSVQPGVIPDNTYILSASAIGVVDKAHIIDGSSIRRGDAILAIESNGLHTNGYSLVRKLLADKPSLYDYRVGGQPLLDVLLLPHRCYYQALRGLFSNNGLKGLAHITGGGIKDNLDRILPRGLGAAVDLAALKVPDVFHLLRSAGAISQEDMIRTFNIGVGLVAVCSTSCTADFIMHFREAGVLSYQMGEVTAGADGTDFHGDIKWREV